MATKPFVPLTPENVAYLVSRYGDDPIGFAMDICGVKTLDKWQRWYLEAVQTNGQGGKQIAIASCHSSGKTYLSSIIAIHRLVCYPESRVIITSATEAQLMTAFSGSLAKVIEHSLISEWFDVLAKSIRIKGVENAAILLQAWSVHRPESFAGVHPTEYPEGGVCLIADEASAIDPVIFESWDGNMMHPNSCLILLGNPLHRRGKLFDAFHSQKDFFMTAQVSALDSSFISNDWIEKMKAQYGEDSDVYRVRVLGQFPLSDSDTFIPDKLLREAVDRKVEVHKAEPIIGGLDVGAKRDKSVLTLRQGAKVIAIIKWRQPDTMIVAGNVAAAVRKYNVRGVICDANGVGTGLYNRLCELIPNKVFAVEFKNFDQYEQEYYNTRTKYWGEARKWLKYGSIPNDADLLAEGPSLLYTRDDKGRYQLESKKLASKRLSVDWHSPDVFDSFAYTFAYHFDALEEPEEDEYRQEQEICWY